ncbi:MAG: hypothetical protein H6581_15920 [Bacteroidia bacterium]|nr:hypothetical protein [Bacteroidia bacterium]
MTRFTPLILLGALIFTLNGCKCKKSDCLNGKCTQGTCVCDFGWEGSGCGELFREKYLGTWNVYSLCNSGISNYTVTIAENAAGSSSISITNLHNQNVTVTAEVTSSTTLDIAQQAFDTTTLSGSGEFDPETQSLTLLITVDGFTPAEECALELSK